MITPNGRPRYRVGFCPEIHSSSPILSTCCRACSLSIVSLESHFKWSTPPSTTTVNINYWKHDKSEGLQKSLSGTSYASPFPVIPTLKAKPWTNVQKVDRNVQSAEGAAINFSRTINGVRTDSPIGERGMHSKKGSKFAFIPNQGSGFTAPNEHFSPMEFLLCSSRRESTRTS